MPRNFHCVPGDTAGRERVKSCQSGWGSGYLALVEPVGDFVRVITPLATHPVRGNTPCTSPFSQGHRVQVDQFT